MVKKNWIIFSYAILVFLLDRISKNAVVNTFSLGESKSVFPFFSITYLENTGAGFSILQQGQSILLLIAVFALFLIFYYYKSIPDVFYVFISVGLLLGGIFGNLYDRIMFGYVIDFLDFHIWPVFNLADTALSVGIILLIYYMWKEDNP